MKDAGISRFSHVQGKVHSLCILDRHYYGIFGSLASKNTVPPDQRVGGVLESGTCIAKPVSQ